MNDVVETTETEQKNPNTISATKTGTDKVVTVDYVFPTTLPALVEKFGEDAVLGAATGQFTINIQALIRRHFDKSQDEIQELVNSWMPGVRGPVSRATPFEKATSQLGKLSPEEKAELLARLQAEA